MQQTPASTVTDALDADKTLRARRLVQLSTFTIGGMVIVAVQHGMRGDLGVGAIMLVGTALMLLCQWINRRGETDWANLTFVMSMALVISMLMWHGEGLRDSASLALPAVLIGAGLLTTQKNFLRILAAIVLMVVLLYLATAFGLRQNKIPDAMHYRVVDVIVVLAISGFAVSLMSGDLQSALTRLQVQIEQYRRSQENLTYLSQHDGLTQLPNRLLGRSRMEQAIANARRNGGQVALLFVDLDDFKSINDSLGHTAGDEFLKQVATRLQGAVRQTDVVWRQGGDEFLVGVTDVAHGEAVSTVADKILTSIASPFHVRGTELTSSCSIGIAVFPETGADFESLLRNADLSVYHAKEAGRNVWRYYDESMNTRMLETVRLVAALRQALANRDFSLHYQPVLDLTSGRVVGAEALLRWHHTERGFISPAEFIPIAEKSGLIVDIGEWVVHEGCRQMAAWQAAGLPPFVLAVNLSPVQFRRGHIETVIMTALQTSGLQPQYLELEITESTLIQDSEKFIDSLQKLKTLGLRIAIDDFGTGYSNLSYLQRFSIDKLKIDQSFVRRLMDGPQQQAIVSAIIQIAMSLQLTTTAEGIEDEPVRQRLAELGCTQGQGYLFARPMPADQFAAWLMEHAGS